jgi:host factor-I protein
VTIFLMKGVKLQGVITWFDAFSMLLRRDGAAQLLYKHAISTIMPVAVPDGLPSRCAGGQEAGAAGRLPRCRPPPEGTDDDLPRQWRHVAGNRRGL